MVSHISFIHPTHKPILSIIWLSLPKLRMTQYDHITITWNSHCTCLSLVVKMIHIFLKPDPNLSIHFATFRAVRWRLSYVIGKKQHLSHCDMHRSRYLGTRGSPKPHTTIFWSQIVLFTIQLFSAVTETIPKPKTEVFRQNRAEPKPRFFGAKWIQFCCPTFVFIYGTKPMSWFRRGDWKVPSKSSAAIFSHLIPEQLCACFESASSA